MKLEIEVSGDQRKREFKTNLLEDYEPYLLLVRVGLLQTHPKSKDSNDMQIYKQHCDKKAMETLWRIATIKINIVGAFYLCAQNIPKGGGTMAFLVKVGCSHRSHFAND